MKYYEIRESEINNFFEEHESDRSCEYIKTINYPFYRIDFCSIDNDEPYYSHWHTISFVILKTTHNTYISKMESLVERFNAKAKEFNTLIEAVDYIYYAFIRYKTYDMGFIRVDEDRLDKDKLKTIRLEKKKMLHVPNWVERYDDIKSEIQKISNKINNKEEDIMLAISKLKVMFDFNK